MRVLLALTFMCSSFSTWAGGTAFACIYQSLTDDGKGHFVLTLKAIEDPDVAVTFEGDRVLVLHIQHSSRDPLPSGNPPVSPADFSAALARISADLKAKTTTRFGVLGSALRTMTGLPGHYRVYGLRLEDEGDPEKRGVPLVVYAY